MQHVWDELVLQGKIRETTRSLCRFIWWDEWPSIPVLQDFRIKSHQHLFALKHAILFDDDTIECSPDEDEFDRLADEEMRRRLCELDKAMLHGKRLTAFVEKYFPCQPPVVFDSEYDELVENVLEQSRNE